MKKERKIDTQKSVIKKVVESGSQEIEKHVTKKRERGITLIALVVTIIIMLILAAVTLNMALGDNGLIQMAKFAANKYEQAAINESLAMQGLVNGINNPESVAPTTTTTPNPTPEEEKPQLKIGDVVNYTPDSNTTGYSLPASQSGYGSTGDTQEIKQENYTWKIMNIDTNNNTVDIIGVPTLAMTKVYLEGATGYNNGVYLLNDICNQLYSNNKLGVKARSINLDDIEGHMTDAGENARNEYVGSYLLYGNTQTYKNENAWYPKLAEYENHVGISKEDSEPTLTTDGIEKSDDGSDLEGKLEIPLRDSQSDWGISKTKGTSIIVKQTYYHVTQNTSYYNEPEFYNLIFGSPTTYWLASRWSLCFSPYAEFGLSSVFYMSIYGHHLFYSDNENYNANNRLAPVVSLGSDITFSKSDGNEWKLSK